MADKEVSIGVRTEGTDQTADDLKKVRDSAKGIGDGMDQAADSSKKLDQAATQAAGAAKPLSDAVDEIAESAKDASSAADDLEKSLDLNSLPEIKKIREELEKLGPAGKKGLDQLDKGLAEIETGGEDVERVLGQIIAEAHRVGQQAGAALGPIAEGFQELPHQVRTSFDRVYTNLREYQNKLERTGDVGTEELEKIVKSTRLMERAIKEAGLEVKDLPKDVQRAMQDIRDETTKATVTVRDLEDAWHEVEGAARSSYDQFTSVEGIFESMGGATAVTAAKVTVLGFAFREAMGLVSKFNEAAGVSPKIMEEFNETIESRVYAVLDNFRDKLFVVGQMMHAVAMHDVEAFKQAVISMDEIVRKTQEDQLAALTKGTEGWKKHREEQAKGTEVVKEQTEATKEQTEATDENSRAQVDASGALDIHMAAIGDMVEALRALQSEFATSKLSVNEAGAAFAQNNEILSAASTRLNESERAYQRQTEQVEKLSRTHKDGSQILQQAIDKQQDLKKRVDEAKEAQSKATQAQRDAEGAYNTAIDKSLELGTAVDTQAEALKKAATASSAMVQPAKDAAGAVTPLRDALDPEKVERFATGLLAINEQLRRLKVEAGTAKKALDDLEKVGEEAA